MNINLIHRGSLSRIMVLLVVIWHFGTVMHGSELNIRSKVSTEPKPILGLFESGDYSEQEGTPVRFALYSNRTVIYRDRKKQFGGFITGTVDEESWQTFEKILAELPEVKTNFAFTEAEDQHNSQIIFDDGKIMRQLAMYGPVSIKKTGSGKAASYSTSLPTIKCQSPMFGSGEIPQSALGAWYETHNFEPKDAHPWVPEYFDVTLNEGEGKKSVTWPASWPQLSAAKPREYGGYSLQMPGKFLNEFERLFRKIGTMADVSGHRLFVGYSVELPSQHHLLACTPLGVPAESLQRPPSLPADFLQTNKLDDIKKMAKSRNYDMKRVASEVPTSNGIHFVPVVDVIDELCQSKQLEEIDAGVELTLEAKRGPLHAASMIASTHTPEETKALIIHHLADAKFLEVVTPLVQESVARGADYEKDEQICAFWQKCKKESNPLAWLPLHRMDIEGSVSFPIYGAGRSVKHLPSTSTEGKLDKQPTRTTPERPFTAVPIQFNEEAAARCVQSWQKRSNGKSESKLFEISSAISPTDLSTKQLLKLQLECVAGMTPREVEFKPVPADRVFEMLFGVASSGGAYSGGEGGAYGRLAAWQSLAALTGVGASGTVDDVYNAVKQSSWWSLSSTSKWFYNIAWDLGVVCLRPDKRHIAVLVASDQD